MSQHWGDQFRTAVRDATTGEKFAQLLAELAAEITNATFEFSRGVKTAYETVPKRRLGDKNFDEVDQARLTVGAFSFFMHVLDRYLVRVDSRVLRQIILSFIFENVVRVYAKSFPCAPAEIEKVVSDHYNHRLAQLAKAPIIFGHGPEDRNTAWWRAVRAICEEDVGRDDHRLLAIAETHLMQALEALRLPDHISAIALVLRLPIDLRKIA